MKLWFRREVEWEHARCLPIFLYSAVSIPTEEFSIGVLSLIWLGGCRGRWYEVRQVLDVGDLCRNVPAGVSQGMCCSYRVGLIESC